MKMRTQLQSNIAHELRTPMASVRGYTRMVLDGRAGDTNPTQREYLSIVTENTNRLINLVNWMTHVLELSAKYLKLTTFDLRDIWREYRDRNVSLLEEKGLELEERFPEESFVTMGDREKIALVMTGLVETAAKAATREGRIIVELSHGRDREVTVKVSYPSEGEPAGIRVPEIEDIVGMHGGRIFVTSKTGEASTFLITLPAVINDGKEKLNHEQTFNPGRRRR
jgi:hypothetical protein